MRDRPLAPVGATFGRPSLGAPMSAIAARRSTSPPWLGMTLCVASAAATVFAVYVTVAALRGAVEPGSVRAGITIEGLQPAAAPAADR